MRIRIGNTGLKGGAVYNMPAIMYSWSSSYHMTGLSIILTEQQDPDLAVRNLEFSCYLSSPHISLSPRDTARKQNLY